MALRYQFDGKPVVMMRSISGEMFAPASINMPCYPCSGVATEASTLLQIPTSAFTEHLQGNPDFSRYYIDALSQDLKKQCANSERLRLKSIRERVLHFIVCESPGGDEVVLSHPISQWADSLGVEPESLYRTLSGMQKEGLIYRVNRRIGLRKL